MDYVKLRYENEKFWDVIIKWTKINGLEKNYSNAFNYTNLIIKEHDIPLFLESLRDDSLGVHIELYKNNSKMSDIEFSEAIATFDKIFNKGI